MPRRAASLRAAYVLDAQSTLLANEDDPRSIKVFDPSNEAKPIGSCIGS